MKWGISADSQNRGQRANSTRTSLEGSPEGATGGCGEHGEACGWGARGATGGVGAWGGYGHLGGAYGGMGGFWEGRVLLRCHPREKGHLFDVPDTPREPQTHPGEAPGQAGLGLRRVCASMPLGTKTPVGLAVRKPLDIGF